MTQTVRYRHRPRRPIMDLIEHTAQALERLETTDLPEETRGLAALVATWQPGRSDEEWVAAATHVLLDTEDVTALGVAVYVPTLVRSAIQAATVAALDSLSNSTRLVDGVPVDSVATEPCGNDRAHGAATVYGGPCEGLCLPCAVVAVTAACWDPSGPDVVSLDVLRSPAVTR